jgi:hypothetical protein
VNAEEVPPIIIGCQNHFIAGTDLQSPQRQFHGKRPTAAGQREGDFVIAGETLFQTFHVAAVVLAPRAIAIGFLEDLKNIFIGERPRRRSLWPRGRAAENRRHGVGRSQHESLTE